MTEKFAFESFNEFSLLMERLISRANKAERERQVPNFTSAAKQSTSQVIQKTLEFRF